MDELSRGLHDETARVIFRDRATDFLAAQGVHDKSAAHVCNCLVNFKAPGEKLENCYADGARELARACYGLKIAHDPTVPGNKKQNTVAERRSTDGGPSAAHAGGPPAAILDAC
eukprot:4541798-Pyramimonas_sp.AAC.1